MEMNEFAYNIATLCVQHYHDKLSKKGKPQEKKEWTLLSAIVQETDVSGLKVVAMGTGSKCIGQGKMTLLGDIVHDSHAEIITRRAFLRYLIGQLEQFYRNQSSLLFQKTSENGSWKCNVKDGVKFHFYTSHTPCGDASIFAKQESTEHCPLETDSKIQDTVNNLELDEPPMKKSKINTFPSRLTNDNSCLTNVESDSRQQFKDINSSIKQSNINDIHRTGAKCTPTGIQDPYGVGCNYHATGALRTKPGRGDRTISMSCSDKMARWNILGIQGALLTHLIDNLIELNTITVGSCAFCQQSVERGIFKRFLPFQSELGKLRTPVIHHAMNVTFFHSRTSMEEQFPDTKLVPAPSAIVWYETPRGCIQEALVNGRKSGVTAKNIHKAEARSSICKKEYFDAFLKLIEMIPADKVPITLRKEMKSYEDFKCGAVVYQNIWESLRKGQFCSWVRSPRDNNNFI